MRSSIISGVAAALSIAAVSALPTISTKGSYFFTSEQERWFVKGVAYQLTDSDPLLDSTQCALDAALMKTLGANAIRVYHVSPGEDHSACMTTFSDNGIYLFVDLDTFDTMIVEDDPSWNSTQEAAFEAIMDEFATYNNTAGFFVGNEVVTDPAESEAAAYVKAAARDMKAYRTSKGYREIPIGYSHADISALRPNLQNYLACGNDTAESIDFFGLNTYEWCGNNTYEGSGYEALTAQVVDYPIPIFMSETGCNTPEPRYFEDQAAIFGSEMTPYWSGAIIYEWIQEVNHYGIITYGDDTDALITSVEAATAVTRSGTPTPVTPDFANLSKQWATLTPTAIAETAYTSTHTRPTCPAYTASTWEIAGNIALPTLNEEYNSAVQYSITAGHAEDGAVASSTTVSISGSGTVTAATTTTTSTSSSSTSKAAAARATAGGMEVIGAGAALGGVMLGFVWWL